MRVPLRWAALAVASLGQLSVVRSNMCTTSTCSSLHTPIPGKDLVVVRNDVVLAWDYESAWRPVNELDASLVPTSRGDLAVEFFVRFEPSPDVSTYEAVLFVNNSPEPNSFFDIRVQYPARILAFKWRGQDVLEGRTRLESKVWHHVVASYSANGGCRWCGRLTLWVNGALDHVWGYVEHHGSVRPQLQRPSLLRGHPGDDVKVDKVGKHVPVWDAEFAQCTDARVWVHELDLSDIRALAAAGPSGQSSSEALLRPPDPLYPSPFKPLVEATKAAEEAEAARQKDDDDSGSSKGSRPAGPVKKGHKSPVLAALAARGTLARPHDADLAESLAWGEGNGDESGEFNEDDDDGAGMEEEGSEEENEEELAEELTRAPLVWHSMNLTGGNDGDDEEGPKNHAMSHWLPNGGLNGPMATCAPLVDFGDALATAAANGDSSVRSHLALDDSSSSTSSSSSSSSGSSSRHRRRVRARRAARRAARDAGPWPSVSVLVWAEDLGDELRADPGQVEALWRSLQASDAFVALSAPGDNEPAWQGSAPEAQKKLRQKKLHQQKKKAKKRKLAAAGGKSSHISSLHPTFSGVVSQDDEGGDEDSSSGSEKEESSSDGAEKALTAGDVIVGVDDPGLGASNDSGTSDDDDDDEGGSGARNHGGWQALVRGLGHGPAPPFREWRPIPCEMVVVTTGGLLEGQKHKETLEDRLARHSTGRVALRVLRSDHQGHHHQRSAKFAEVAHWAALASGGDLLVFLKPNVIPLKGWLTDMLHVHATNGKNNPKTPTQSKARSACTGGSSSASSNDAPSDCANVHTDGEVGVSTIEETDEMEETAGIVGAVVLYPSGRVFSAGLEYHDTPVASPSEAQALAAAAAESARNDVNNHRRDGSSSSSSSTSNNSPGVILPAHRLRGYGARDARLEAGRAWPAAGVTRHCLLVSRQLFFSLGGFQADLSGSLADADLALRLFEANGQEVNRREAKQQIEQQQQFRSDDDETDDEDASFSDHSDHNTDSAAVNIGRGAAAWVAAAAAERDVESLVQFDSHGSHHHTNTTTTNMRAPLFARLPRVLVATGARVVSSNPESYPELENSYAAQAFDFQFGAERERSVEARKHFVTRWAATLARSLAALRVTSAKLSWIVHCGGSQGYEAASIVGALEPLAKNRLIVRRYRDCEHTDTLSGTPGAFRDAFDRAALRRFVGAYQPPTTTATPVLQNNLSSSRNRRAASKGNSNSNGTISMEVEAIPNDGTSNQLNAAHVQSAAMAASSSTAESADVAAAAAARVAARAAAHSKRLFHEAAVEAHSSSSGDSRGGGGNGKAAHAAALAAARAAGVLSFGGQARLPSTPSPSDSSKDSSSSSRGSNSESTNATAAATAAGAWASYEDATNHQGAGSIAVYARDWREAGRWLPRDAAFVVGRYMFEAASLPEAWVHHCNSLDEIWVPSQWQVEAFAQSGVNRNLLAVMPEALDVWHYDPRDVATSPLPLAGTVLDGKPLDDPLRPFVFLSVFKMEDRKGWRELVKAYMTEFEGTQDLATGRDTVVLLLRTYVHVEGSGFVHSKAKVMDKITRYLSKTIGYHPDSSRPWPRVEVVQEHLPAASMPSLYKAADCFVLPTHGEGWGLPTMEAMAMGLPVITTNWGGSTEFVTPETGYLLPIEGVVSTQQMLDSPYKGNRWAQPSSRHLRALMREVRDSLTDPHTGHVLRGRRGRGPTTANAAAAASKSSNSKPSSHSSGGVSAIAGEAAAAAAASAGARAAMRSQPGTSGGSGSSSGNGGGAAARGIMARAHIVESYRPSMVAAVYAQQLDHIHRTKLLPAAQAKTAAAAAATKAANAAAVAAAARASEAASSTTTSSSSSSAPQLPILAPPPEGDFYRGDEVVANLDSGWQLSESYATCSVHSRPFSLRDLPLNSPARAPRGVGTARLGTTSDGGPGGGNLCHIAILSTYVPRECGIAIYSERLVQGLRSVCGAGARIEVIPVKHANMALSEYDPATVKVAIREWELDDYLDAAAYVNREGFGLVLLQYEFGIWPVAHVLCFAKTVKTRLITTIHTVARTYASEEYHAYVAQLSVVSHKLTVMTERMRHELDAFHAIPPHRIAVIPHGTPQRPLRRVQNTPRQKFFPGRKVIMSNGLMHGYKGIEYMIEAMPAVLARHPNALYLVDGKPHPGGWGVQGYYAGLKRRATELGLMGTSVVFHNTFTPYDELLAKLEASWVYVNPYTDASQSVSGTVAMALSVGTAVVSTPYPYAAETLTNGVGVFVPFRDSNALAVAIADLLDSPLKVAQLNLAAHAYAQNMTWEKVARSHLDLARSLGDD